MTALNPVELEETLAQLLAAQGDACSQLLELSRREQEALLLRNTDVVAHLTREKEELVASLAQLETARVAVAADWARARGLRPMTLGEMLQHCAAPLAAHLADLRATLVNVAQELAHVNRGNWLLARSAAAQLNATLELRAGVLAPAPVYSSNGRIRATNRSLRLMDGKL